MKEPDSLDSLLREWKAPEPSTELDQSIMAAYRTAVRKPRHAFWQRFWTKRISVPAPALVAVAVLIFAILIWLRPSAVGPASPGKSDVLTRLDVSGFQPLPNGEARVIPAGEIRK
jgi:hypothetical protein